MGKGMKLFIGASAGILLVLVGVLCYSVVSQRQLQQRQRQCAAIAKQMLDKSDQAYATRDYETADTALRQAQDSANKMPRPDTLLLTDIEKRRAPIQQGLTAMRAEIEARRRMEAERERLRLAEEQKRLQEKRAREREAEEARVAAETAAKEAASALAQAKKMYPAYKESAAVLADEILKFLSATETGLTFAQHGERLQNLQFVYNKFALRCEKRETQYTSYRTLEKAVATFKIAGAAWDDKLKAERDKNDALADMRLADTTFDIDRHAARAKEAADRSHKSELALQEAWAQARDLHRDAMATLGKGE